MQDAVYLRVSKGSELSVLKGIVIIQAIGPFDTWPYPVIENYYHQKDIGRVVKYQRPVPFGQHIHQDKDLACQPHEKKP